MRIIRYVFVFFYNLFCRSNVKSFKTSIKSSLGENVKICEDVEIDSKTSIGKYTYIGQYSTITSSRIGNYCSIASFVKIGHGEHDLDRVSTNSIFYKNTYEELTKKKCEIGNDVWIGTDAIILRGVKIGDGAVIGANSVVNIDIPEYSVAVGSPVRILKKRFDAQKINKIKKTEWWNYDYCEAASIIKELQND
ncbi:CatB-related O-acetyltransferase [Labilibaculum euxinus]